jgi:archaellum component FlaC
VDDVSMEARLAKFESDMGHMKKDVARIAEDMSALRAGLNAANDAVGSLKTELAKTSGELRTDIAGVRSELKSEIAGARSGLKEEIGKVREDVSAIKATLPQFATKSDLSAMETRIIKWFIFTAVAIGTLAFSIAKLVS